MMVDIEKLRGADVVADTLKRAGVSTVFTLHGGHLDGIYHRCQRIGIRLVDVRHEASAGHAAEAWGRLSRDIGVCMVTAGPGFTNSIASIVNAHHDRTPVLYIVGAQPLREDGLNVMQGGLDQAAIAKPFAKYSVRISDPSRLEDQLALAISIARSGAPGPVVVELPLDVLSRPVLPGGDGRVAVRVRPSAPQAADIDETVELLRNAARPVLILGGVAAYQVDRDAVNAFVRKTGIPAVSSNRALGLVDPEASEYAHTPDSLATAKALGHGAVDVALVLGARFGMGLGGRSESHLPADCRIIHVDPDVIELGRIRSPVLASTADCNAFLAALAEHWPDELPTPERLSWRDRLVSVRHEVADAFPELTVDGRPHPFHAAQAVVSACPPGCIFVIDGGESAAWALYHVATAVHGGVLAFGPNFTLGTGPGMALGAALQSPERRIVHITGDGALGLNIAEFDTFVRHRTPVVTVVLNNDVWGMSIHGQRLQFGETYSAVSAIPGVAYDAVGGAFGLHAETVTTLLDIPAAMQRAFASGQPACINLLIPQAVYPPVSEHALKPPANDDIHVPYYEDIPR